MIDLLSLQDFGLSPVAHDSLNATQAARLACALDLGNDFIADGVLPITWIWAFFNPMTPTSQLRTDGHPNVRSDGLLAGLERRMLIGGQLDLCGELRLDTATERTSSVVNAQNKHGQTGPFMLVEIEHRYSQRGDLVLAERQQLMYRAATSDPVAAPGEATPPTAPSDHSRTLVPDERLLFRYSAITFNTHRIHYDIAYAMGQEGFPGLVVHGPLTATLLASLATEALDRNVTSFSFRATAPTFANVALTFTAVNTTQGGAELQAVRSDGVVVMEGRAN